MSASADINTDKLAEFFVEKVEGVLAMRRRCRMFVMNEGLAALQLPRSFHRGSAASTDGSPAKSSVLDLLPVVLASPEIVKDTSVEDWRQLRSYAPL